MEGRAFDLPNDPTTGVLAPIVNPLLALDNPAGTFGRSLPRRSNGFNNNVVLDAVSPARAVALSDFGLFHCAVSREMSGAGKVGKRCEVLPDLDMGPCVHGRVAVGGCGVPPTSVGHCAVLMDEIEALSIWFMHKSATKKKKVNRKYWVHPINSVRPQMGAFHALFEELRRDPDKFFNYYRMSASSFEELLTNIQNSITKDDTNMRASISPRERLSLTLRYLATGCSMTDLHYQYRMGVSTISLLIREVCKAVWNCMKDTCMGQPDEERWLQISEGFWKNSNFPNCIGAIDGKHVRVIKPKCSGCLYYNYKNYFSVQLLAICDSDYCFTYVDIGDYGKNNDASIYANTLFNKKLQTKTLNIPDPVYLDKRNDSKMPFVLVGDEAFALSNSMMRPYGGKNLTQDKRVFNYRLSRARRLIECSFGILTNKWRIFHRPMNVKIETAIDIIKACVILHNFVRRRDGYLHEDCTSYSGLMDNEESITRNYYSGTPPTTIRDYLKEYFLTEGELPWQYAKI